MRLPQPGEQVRSMALTSVAVPTVERVSELIRSWFTMMAVVSPFQNIDIGPRQRRHEPLQEGAVGLV